MAAAISPATGGATASAGLRGLGRAALLLLCRPDGLRGADPGPAARAEAGGLRCRAARGHPHDLARSPWSGEGHRKVWARLRVLDGIRVGRKRVLRLMREHALLSPHRARSGRPTTTTAASSPTRRT